MEHAFIAWVKNRVASLPKVAVGIGDDAAVLAPHAGNWVVTTDSLCDGTHFRLEECGPRAVGQKIAAVNLSDLAAMGADPTAFFLSLCLPRTHAASLATEIIEGILVWAEPFQVALAGGDTNTWDGPLAVNITAIGTTMSKGSLSDRPAWLRSGAKPGDAIVVSGTLGGSLLGKHFTFEPRLRLARWLRENTTIHAACDISDGLGQDLLNLFTQSGCGACLDLDTIPISEAAHTMSKSSQRSPLDHAMSDGEDFELLLAIPMKEARALPSEVDGVPLRIIGEFTPRTGLWARENGKWRQIPPRGYVHR